MPRISVMIPTYNRAHLVGRTIESVLGQQFQDWSLVIVDDASGDNTVEVVREYCCHDPRLRLVTNEKNLGLTRNWNRCLDLASGPLVQVLQSDDLIDSDYLGLASQVFEEHPEIGFVAASCRHIDADGRVIHPGTSRPAQLYRPGDEAVEALLMGGWPHVTSIIFQQKCYKELGLFNESIWHGPDGEFFTRLACRYGFYHSGGVHTSFRRHGSNMGALEYLRHDFLEVDMYKKRLTWSYLSSEGQQRLGVLDLDRYIARNGARTALAGAILTVAYGSPRLGCAYLRQAIELDGSSWRTGKFWKAAALLVISPIGRRLMRKRMQVREVDQPVVRAVSDSLSVIGPPDE